MSKDEGKFIQVPTSWLLPMVVGVLGVAVGGGGGTFLAKADNSYDRDKDLIEYRMTRLEEKYKDIDKKLDKLLKANGVSDQ